MARRSGSDGARTEIAIREAATRLFARLGYEAMTMRGLGREIGIGAAALYRYFPTKQALLFDILERHMHGLLAAWNRTRLSPERPAMARLETFTGFHIRFHMECADALFLSYMELRSLTAENFDAIAELRRRYEAELSGIIASGIAEGSLRRQEPRIAARAVLALLNGLNTWYRAEGPVPPTEIENIYQEMVAGLAGAQTTKESSCSMPA